MDHHLGMCKHPDLLGSCSNVERKVACFVVIHVLGVQIGEIFGK